MAIAKNCFCWLGTQQERVGVAAASGAWRAELPVTPRWHDIAVMALSRPSPAAAVPFRGAGG